MRVEFDSSAFAKQWNPGPDEAKLGSATIPFFHRLEELHKNARSFPMAQRFPQLAHAIEAGVLRTIDTDEEVEAIAADMQRDALKAWTEAK